MSYIEIYKTNATTTATIMSSRRIALSRYTALLTAAFGVDKKMLPEIPLKHEMKLLKFEHNKLKNTQVDDKTYYKYNSFKNIICTIYTLKRQKMCILHHFLNKIQQRILNCSYCWCIIHIRFFLDTKSQSIFLHQILQQLSEQNKHYASQHELHDSKLYKQLLNIQSLK